MKDSIKDKVVVAFDVDDTLIVPSVATGLPTDTPNYDNIRLFKQLQGMGCYMIVWSGSGMDWAQRWCEKLGLEPDAIIPKEKNKEVIDLCFDDCVVDLAKTNIRVKRVNNSISRNNWNKTKQLKR